MKKVKTRIIKPEHKKVGNFYYLKGALLSPFFWISSWYLKVPGLVFQKDLSIETIKLLVKGKLSIKESYDLILRPMDSFRYFEFGMIWGELKKPKFNRVKFLDVSSPRLLPLMFIKTNPNIEATLINPDTKDLEETKNLAHKFAINSQINFQNALMEDVDLPEASFDVVTCISVIEHIPGDGDKRAIEKIWRLIKPGGRLFLSVPCSSAPFEEYLDFNEYGLLKEDNESFVFGQRFYDENLLSQQIIGVTGSPVRKFIYGEKIHETFMKNRQEKISNEKYAFWKEPLMMGKDYGFFRNINELNNLGVILLEFKKS